MRIVIGYESMYGTTRQVAECIAAGFDTDDDVQVCPVALLDEQALAADLLIIGAPTHAHGLPRPSTRKAAFEGAAERSPALSMDPAADKPGVREWLARLPEQMTTSIAIYDTRFRMPGWIVGHPARRVARVVRRRGAHLVGPVESFFVGKSEKLQPGEFERALEWARDLRMNLQLAGGAIVRPRA